MDREISALEDGAVLVEVKSKRGTGSHDEDVVVARATYADVDEAERESHRLNQIVRARLLDARDVDTPTENGQDGGAAELSNTPPRDREEPAGSDRPGYSNVYLGAGSELSGWSSLPKQVVLEDIAPLVSQNTVDDEKSSITVDFGGDLPMSGETDVDADVVVNEIEPIVRVYRDS